MPGNRLLAERMLDQALVAGDRALALRAAHALERSGPLPVEGQLLLLDEALAVRDWKDASARIDRIGQDQVFSFMAPILRAWTAFGSGKGDPLAILDAGKVNPLTASYLAEHRPLLDLALGKTEEGIAGLKQLDAATRGRASRLRIAGAALLAQKGDRAAALSLLQGDAPPIAAARRLIESGKPVPGAIDDARTGIAELLVRIAVDLQRQNVEDLGLSFARLATFLAPENSETWLVTGELLGSAGQEQPGLAALSKIRPGDPFAATAQDMRIRLTLASGDKAAALAEAQALVKSPAAGVDDWTRLGDLYAELERYDEAADAYGKAIALNTANESSHSQWALLLLRGGALERAGHWPEAKKNLEAAYKLAPNQPAVLNYLGYAQLERRENVAEALKLVQEASRLAPDSAAITDSLGWAYYLRGDLPKAIGLLERAARGAPADAAINEHLGDAYYRAGRRFEARYAWEAALTFADEGDAERLRAKIEKGLTPALASP